MKKKILALTFLAIPLMGFSQVKISELPETTSPTSSDSLLIVNGGQSKKVSTANLLKTNVPLNPSRIFDESDMSLRRPLNLYGILNLLTEHPNGTLLDLSSYGGTTSGTGVSQLFMTRYRGTLAEGLPLKINDIISEIRARGALSPTQSGTLGELNFIADEDFSPTSAKTSLYIRTTDKGEVSRVARYRFGGDGLVQVTQPSPLTFSSSTTLPFTALKQKIVIYSGALGNLQMPPETEIRPEMRILYQPSFDFTILNKGSGAATLTPNTGVTIEGNATIPNGTSATFRLRKDSPSTAIVYRL